MRLFSLFTYKRIHAPSNLILAGGHIFIWDAETGVELHHLSPDAVLLGRESKSNVLKGVAVRPSASNHACLVSDHELSAALVLLKCDVFLVRRWPWHSVMEQL